MKFFRTDAEKEFNVEFITSPEIENSQQRWNDIIKGFCKIDCTEALSGWIRKTMTSVQSILQNFSASTQQRNLAWIYQLA